MKNIGEEQAKSNFLFFYRETVLKFSTYQYKNWLFIVFFHILQNVKNIVSYRDNIKMWFGSIIISLASIKLRQPISYF